MVKWDERGQEQNGGGGEGVGGHGPKIYIQDRK